MSDALVVYSCIDTRDVCIESHGWAENAVSDGLMIYLHIPSILEMYIFGQRTLMSLLYTLIFILGMNVLSHMDDPRTQHLMS